MSALDTESQQVLYLIKSEKDYAGYFFARATSLKWFFPLKLEKYFEPDNIIFDANGNANFWLVLNYLERVSEQVVQNKKYGKELLDIIEDIVQFSKNKKRINNYHIWWYCVKIINNLPVSIITENLPIEDSIQNSHARYGFRTWLMTWTDPTAGSDLTISDIGIKLLPKFLKDDSTIDYAEAILELITEIGPVGKRHPSRTREDAKLRWDSYWIFEAFKKNGQLIGQKCSIKAVLGIADKLKRALEYKHKSSFNDFSIEDAVYQIAISRVTVEGKSIQNIQFKEDEYHCSVNQFSEKQLEGNDRQHLALTLYNIEPEIQLKKFSFTASSKEEFISAVMENLPKGINWAKAEDFKKRIGFIYGGMYEDYSHIWFKSLDSGRDFTGDTEEVLTIILKDVLIAKCEANRVEGGKVLDVFLSDKFLFPIFRRFVLLCVDKYWDDYSEWLEKFFKIVPNALHEVDCEVELYDVLLHHNQKFTSSLIAKLKGFISDVPEYYQKIEERAEAAWKFKWLSPLKERNEFRDEYIEAKEKYQPKDGKDYEPERSALQGGFITHKSPISKEDILKKPVVELVKYLGEFQGAEFWRGTFEGEPDNEGLADALQAAVKDDPKRFTDEIDVLYETPYFYLNRVFRGLKEAWNSNTEIDWEKIFNFSLKYFRRDKDSILKEVLQAQKDDSGKGKYIWIVESIVELIGDGSQNDSRAFDPQYFDKVEQIFDLMVPLLKGEKQPDKQRDALTYALNTTLGRAIMAYIRFSLRVARATKKTKDNWGIEKYERFFLIGIDSYIWFGSYLPQMRYLDKKYTEEKIELFSSKKPDDFEWQMFMEGYISGSRVYDDVFSLMRKNYVKALENKLFGERIDQRLVEHICIGYSQLGELLQQKNSDGKTDSLFWKMLNEAKIPDTQDRWIETAGFFWSISSRTLKQEEKEEKKELPKEFKTKILAFWDWTFREQEFVKNRLGNDYNSFLSRIAEMTIWLDKIDDVSEKWILLSAPFIENQHRSFFFIEYLTKFEDEESIKRIGKIFLKVLENSTPTFKQEEIQLIVERLYKLGRKDSSTKADADNICNTYGRRGIHFLKELWSKNQNK